MRTQHPCSDRLSTRNPALATDPREQPASRMDWARGRCDRGLPLWRRVDSRAIPSATSFWTRRSTSRATFADTQTYFWVSRQPGGMVGEIPEVADVYEDSWTRRALVDHFQLLPRPLHFCRPRRDPRREREQVFAHPGGLHRSAR